MNDSLKRKLALTAAVVGLFILSSLFPHPGAASGIVPTAYQTVKNTGTALAQRNTINCTGALVCSDVGGQTQMDVTSGAGGVTSVATGCGLSGGTITASGTIISSQAVNAQTGTTYTVQNGDCGKLVTTTNGSTIAITLPQAGSGGNFASGWWVYFENRGAGTATITPTTSTIDGASSLALVTNQGVYVASDGTNYFTQRGLGAPSSNQNIRSFGGSFDGGGVALTTGKTSYVTVPFACTIAAWNILVDTGTVSFDVWKVATGTAIPTVSNTILTGGFLAISTGTALHSTDLSKFTTTTVTANDIVGINIQAVSSATVVQLVVQCNATT